MLRGGVFGSMDESGRVGDAVFWMGDCFLDELAAGGSNSSWMEACSSGELSDGGFGRSFDGLEWVGSTISAMEACLRVSASVELDDQGCRKWRTLSLGCGNGRVLWCKVSLILASRVALNSSITERRRSLTAG